MRIALVLHDLGTGGTERVALTLARQWQRLGAEVKLFLGAAEGPQLLPPGVGVEVLDPPVTRSPMSRLAVARAMVGPLSRWAPDVLFLPRNWHFAMAPAFARVRPRPLIVGKLSNPPVPDGLAWLGGGLVFRALAGFMDAIAAWPEASAVRAERHAGGTRVARVPNPPLVLPVTGADAATRAPSGRVVVVGRLVRQKDPGLAIAGFAHARARRPELRLEVAGDGPERARLERMAAGLPVAFLGQVGDAGSVLAGADALLLTSRYEGTPAIVLEALAARVPVVATDCAPVVRDWLDGPGRGRLVEGRTAEAVGHALLDVLARPGPMPGVEALLAAHAPAAVAAAYLALFAELASG